MKTKIPCQAMKRWALFKLFGTSQSTEETWKLYSQDFCCSFRECETSRLVWAFWRWRQVEGVSMIQKSFIFFQTFRLQIRERHNALSKCQSNGYQGCFSCRLELFHLLNRELVANSGSVNSRFSVFCCKCWNLQRNFSYHGSHATSFEVKQEVRIERLKALLPCAIFSATCLAMLLGMKNKKCPHAPLLKLP